MTGPDESTDVPQSYGPALGNGIATKMRRLQYEYDRAV